MSMGPLYVFLGEVSVQPLPIVLIGLFVFLGWSCVSSLYFLEIQPLSEVSLANVFPYSWLSFHFNAVSLALQKLFILMRSHLFILYVPRSSGHISENIAVWNICDFPMFS